MVIRSRNPGAEPLYGGKGYRMARIYQTRSWHDQMSPSMEEMELLALEAHALDVVLR